MAKLLAAAILLALCLAHAASACSMAQHKGIRLGGANLPNASTPQASASDCCNWCEGRTDCVAWTFNTNGGGCWLTGAGYAAHGNQAGDETFISGWLA